MGNQNQTIVSSAARTSSGNQAAPLDVSQTTELAAFVVVTAVSGTSPAMTVTLQDSPDGTNFADVYSFPAITSATVLRASWQDFGNSVGRYLRAKWTITGTSPSFTFSVHAVPAN